MVFCRFFHPLPTAWTLLFVCALLGPASAKAGVAGWRPEDDRPPARLTLEAALDRVIATDQTVAIADYEVRKAAVDQLRALTRVLPSLSAGADASWRGSRRKDEVEVFDSRDIETDPLGAGSGGTTLGRVVRESRWSSSSSDTQSVGLSFNQPILDFTLGPARRTSALDRQISEWQLRRQLREVLFSVTALYFEILKQQDLIAENTKTLGLTSQQVEQARARFEAQEIIQADVLLSRVDDERARRAVLLATNRRDLARTRLAITLNYPANASFEVAEPPSGTLGYKDLSEAVAVALPRREDIRIAELTVSRTDAERAGLKARFAPTLDFQVSSDAAVGSEFERTTGWTAGLSFNWTLIDRGTRVLDLKTNALQREQDDLRVSDTTRGMADEVATAWYAIDELRKTAASLEAERLAAEAALPVQQGKYRAGLATNLEVQSAIRDVARVRAEAVVNAYELEIAYRDLDNVLALYQNARIEAALTRLLSRPEPRFFEPLPRATTPAAVPPATTPAPPRSGRK
jgi:outer membrane protein TolC